jgi:HEPN domain-containing protein
MTAPLEELARQACQWVVYADEDLVLAKHGLSLGEKAPLRLIAYHAQQCAEKYLKAYLVWKGIDFPYTHNIARLLELVGAQGPWVQELRDAARLTPFAITARYPGEDSEVAREEAEQAIAIAESVRQTVRRALMAEGLKL